MAAIGIVRLRFHFPSAYSYRLPDTSPGYAPCSPVTSPLTIRLALVDAAIRVTASVDEGERVFHLVKNAPLWLVPPSKVSMAWAFIRRLKPRREEGVGLVTSTGLRQFCWADGPLEAYLQIRGEAKECLLRYATHIRRLGSSDSLAYVVADCVSDVPRNIAIRPLAQVSLPLNEWGDMFPPVRLKDLPEQASFGDVNPYRRVPRGFEYKEESWVLPLRVVRRGGKWVVYERVEIGS